MKKAEEIAGVSLGTVIISEGPAILHKRGMERLKTLGTEAIDITIQFKSWGSERS